MGRRPIGRKAMTSAERVRRTRARQRAAKLKRATARMDAAARPVIAAVMAGGDLEGVSPDTRQGCIATAEAVLAGLRAAGLSIVRTSSLK
jgi:hypothetical protein